GCGPAQERSSPEVGQVARGPLAGHLAGGTRKQGRVLGRDVIGRVALPEAVEVVDLLADRGALDRRVAAHRVVPPARAAALRADPHVIRGTDRPSVGALGDLEWRVPGPQAVHETCKSNARPWAPSTRSAGACAGARARAALAVMRPRPSSWACRAPAPLSCA